MKRIGTFKLMIAIGLITASLYAKKSGKLTAAKITHFFPVFKKSKLIRYDTTETFIYYKQDQILYDFTYHLDSSIIYFNRDDKNDTMTMSGWKHFYLVLTKGKNRGLRFEKESNKYQVIKPIDSVLKLFLPSLNLYTMLSERNNILKIKDSVDLKSRKTYEEYYLSDKKDTLINCTLLLKFTNEFSNIEYSLSNELDSIKKMKLCDVKISTKAKYYKSHKYTLDGFEIAFHMEQIPVTNEDELLYYFEQDRKMNIEQKE